MKKARGHIVSFTVYRNSGILILEGKQGKIRVEKAITLNRHFIRTQKGIIRRLRDLQKSC